MSVSPETIPKSPVKLTYKEYVLFPADGNRHEVIDGRHYMNAAPNPRHQSISRHIQFQLFEQIELQGYGEVIDAPIDLQLSEFDVVQPDLVVVLKENPIITSTKIKGIPDLVIEILSPSNRTHDLDLKMRLYEQFRVPEFWIVDSEEENVLKFCLTDEGRFAPAEIYTSTISWQPSFGKAHVDLKRVW
jgi:Uma2 family endonuclease